MEIFEKYVYLIVLVFVVGMLCFDMHEERSLIKKNLRTMDALQVSSVRQLGMSG